MLLGVDWRCWVGAPCHAKVLKEYTLPHFLNTGLIAGQKSQVYAFIQILMNVDVRWCATYTKTDASADQALAYCALKQCNVSGCPKMRLDVMKRMIEGACTRHTRNALFTHRWGGLDCKRRLPTWRQSID